MLAPKDIILHETLFIIPVFSSQIIFYLLLLQNKLSNEPWDYKLDDGNFHLYT